MAKVTMSVEIPNAELALELARQLDHDEVLLLIKSLDSAVAEEEFTLELARWAKNEEQNILEDRRADATLNERQARAEEEQRKKGA